MLIVIDPTRDEALYAQVAAGVRAEIAAGRLHAGDRLPPARDVAGGLGMNLHTVLRAYQELRDEGLVDMRRGRGAVVTAAATGLEELHEDVDALVQKARALGVSAGTLGSLVTEALR